jgi:hypothetical protein
MGAAMETETGTRVGIGANRLTRANGRIASPATDSIINIADDSSVIARYYVGLNEIKRLPNP